MKLVQYAWADKMRVGICDGTFIVDPLSLDESSPFMTLGQRGYWTDMVRFVGAGEDGRAVAKAAIKRSREVGQGRIGAAGLRLLAPMFPSIILCSGGNYRDHVAEKEDAPLQAKEPEFFLKSPTCVIGPGEAILWDKATTRKLDYETELAIVIGKAGRHIPTDRAMEHIFGFTIMNDATARDRQVRSDGKFTWYETGPGKNFDTSAPMGPCIVTVDDIADPQSLALRTRVNGQLRQSNSTASMIFGVAELVHFFSVNFTLEPGFVIITGTPGGTAWAQDGELGGKNPTRDDVVAAAGYLEDGDIVECEIENIGVLENPVRLWAA